MNQTALRLACLVIALCVDAALTANASAQGIKFSYDSSGNTLNRVAETTAAPQIVGQPVNQVAVPGTSASFSVVVANARGMTYQWQFNGSNIPGATGDALLLGNITAANEGSYTVTATNAAGSVTSSAATLALDSDGDGLADSWEIANFGTLNQTATGDFDGDGISNLDEFLQGTNPASSASYRARLTVLTTGGGTVTVSPAKANYALGDTVTLTAVPTAPYSFDHWSGDLATTASTTTLTLSANKNVTAVFSYAPVPSGVIAWWRGETDASDLIAGHQGTFYVGTTPVTPAVTATGMVGGALNFNGTNYVRVPDAADLHPERYTFETWIYPTSSNSATQTLFARGSSTGTKLSWGLSLSNGQILFEAFDVTGTYWSLYSNGGGTFAFNQWTHVAGSFDGVTLRLYINGNLSVSQKTSGLPYYDPAAVPVTIGSGWVAGASARPFTGLIDELSFYNRALSDAEVAAIANIGRIGKTVAQPCFPASAPLADGVIGDAYAASLGAVIGPAPFSFSVLAGGLPPGLSLAESGALTGTPTTVGDYLFTMAVRDAAGRLNQGAYTIHVTQRIAAPLGMLGWWRCEPDASGLARDQVAGHDGTFYRNGTAASAADAAGKVGRAFAFDGALHIRVPDTASLRPSLVSGEAWVYPAVYGTYLSALAKGSSTGSEDTWWLGILNGYPQFYSWHTNNSGNALTGSTPLPLGQWSHLAFTFDGSTTTLYVNGVAVSLQIGLGPLVYSNSVPLTIGTDWGNGAPTDFFVGRIDEVTLYDRALSAREVAALAASGVAGKALTGPFTVDLGNAATGRAFVGNFSFPMGVAPVTYSLISGALPPGFVLGSNGVVSGTTGTRGGFTFTVRATDANGAYQDQTASLHSYLAATRPPGLISWYRAENSALDAIGSNGGALVGAAGYGSGKVGAAFTLHGSPDLVQIPDSASLRPPTISAEAWVSAQSIDGINAIIGKTVGTGQADTWTLYNLYGRLHANITTANGNADISADWSPQRGRWYHVALAYDGAQLRLYINGARVAATAASGALAYDNHPVIFGADIESESLAYYFNGQIDETALYNRGLTDSEVASIYAADLAGKALPGYGDNEDRDGDGLANVLEYGLGTNADVFNASPAITTLANGDGTRQGKLVITRDPAKTDMTITIESSGDLMDWVPIATSVNGAPFVGIATITGEVSGTVPRAVAILDPYAGARGFLRIRVSR